MRNTQTGQHLLLPGGSKRDGCVVRQRVDLAAGADQARAAERARCGRTRPGHCRTPAAVDASEHPPHLAPSTRPEPAARACARLIAFAPAIPFVSGVDP